MIEFANPRPWVSSNEIPRIYIPVNNCKNCTPLTPHACHGCQYVNNRESTPKQQSGE